MATKLTPAKQSKTIAPKEPVKPRRDVLLAAQSQRVAALADLAQTVVDGGCCPAHAIEMAIAKGDYDYWGSDRPADFPYTDGLINTAIEAGIVALRDQEIAKLAEMLKTA